VIYTITLNPTLDRTLRFPELRVGELNRATSSRIDLSGKGVNVSLALRRFGLDSVVMGIRAGHFGRMLLGGLTDLGFECDLIDVPGETRSNITVIDESTGVTTKLNEPGPTVGPQHLAALENRLMSRVVSGDWCVLSGSLPPGAAVDTYGYLVGRLSERGVMVVLDTSGDALRRGCAAGPYLLKPNTVEAHELLGRHLDDVDDLAEGLAEILDLGPRRVLLSLDSRGAAYADGRRTWYAEAPAIEEVSAVGAGDAFLAGALWAALEGWSSEEILRWGVASGTAAALGDGSAMPEMDLIREVYAEVTVRPLRRCCPRPAVEHREG